MKQVWIQHSLKPYISCLRESYQILVLKLLHFCRLLLLCSFTNRHYVSPEEKENGRDVEIFNLKVNRISLRDTQLCGKTSYPISLLIIDAQLFLYIYIYRYICIPGSYDLFNLMKNTSAPMITVKNPITKVQKVKIIKVPLMFNIGFVAKGVKSASV